MGLVEATPEARLFVKRDAVTVRAPSFSTPPPLPKLARRRRRSAVVGHDDVVEVEGGARLVEDAASVARRP